MKKDLAKRIIAVLLAAAAVLTLASCRWLVPGKQKPDAVSPTAEPTAAASETESAGPSPTDSAVDDFLTVEPTASQVGQYLTEHARDLPAADNDKLLERLLLLQLDITMEMSYKILNDAYMSALNDTMGGILDPTKIDNIKNETVRGDFRMLFDGMMTVVRYEESPGIETDWGALNKLEASFGPQAALMIGYGSRLQGTYYSDPAKGFDLMAADIAAIEKQFRKTDAGFVRWKLHHLYTRLVSSLLFGPEGEYIDGFTAGNKEVKDRLTSYADTYRNTRFGQTCRRLLETTKNDMPLVYGLVNNSTVFPPDDTRSIGTSVRTVGGAVLNIPVLKDTVDTELAAQISKTLDDAAAGMLTKGKTGQRIDCDASSGGNYLSVTFSYTYTNKDGQYGYEGKNIIIDLKTGGTVTLDSLAGKPFEAYSELLRAAMHGDSIPQTLKAPVDFSLDGSGIMLWVPRTDSPYPDNYNVTLNGLRSFMDISKLY
jgi:hypothetical protein